MAVFISDGFPLHATHLADPLLDLGVAVQKREAASAVVESGRKITPGIRAAPIQSHRNEPAIVDGIGMLIEEHKNVARALRIARFLEHLVLVKTGRIILSVRPT